MEPIRFWNRATQTEETEFVYGDKAIKWLYGETTGQKVADHVLSRKLFSYLYGAFQDSVLSRPEIENFIQKFKIPMDEYEPGPFHTFNKFFIRKFRPGKRVFVLDSHRMPAFAEGRYLAFEACDQAAAHPVKGCHLTVNQLLGPPGAPWVSRFENGPALVARLCPVDYHRFHFPDSGTVLAHYRQKGKLHSVNPAAMKYKPSIFLTNERQITILDTDHFGKLAYIEVGAMSVGKIVQTYQGSKFSRGDEKGYFLFGASTVLLLGEPGKWTPSSDLLEQTKIHNRETLVQLGQEVALA